MKYYFAPLEGVTGYIFRNAHHQYYPGIDKYYAPFISPAKEGSMTKREKDDLVSEHNEGINVVPQVMTNQSDYMIRAVRELKELGYEEVNLNLGCPSGTVTAKGKGAGFLAKPEELDQFLDNVFGCREISDINISVKTRLGKTDPDEFYELLRIFNSYPISELTIHPRIQKDFYKAPIRKEFFDYALQQSENILVYNGDLCTTDDIDAMLCRLHELKPKAKVSAMMLGRGLLKNPELIMWHRDKMEQQIDYRRLKAFHDEIYKRYQEVMSPDKNVLYRMKELWCYLSEAFTGCDKQMKQIRKAERFGAYDAAVMQIFQNYI